MGFFFFFFLKGKNRELLKCLHVAWTWSESQRKPLSYVWLHLFVTGISKVALTLQRGGMEEFDLPDIYDISYAQFQLV